MPTVSSPTTFTVLCCLQMVAGMITGSFGIADRVSVGMSLSFFMLPVWQGALMFAGGVIGIFVGRQNRIYSTNKNAVTGVRAINALCAAVALVSFAVYGLSIGSVAKLVDQIETAGYYGVITIPGSYTDSDTIQAIYAFIMLLDLIEMLLGAWLAMLSFDAYVISIGQRAQDRAPLIVGSSNQIQQNVPVVVQQPVVQQQLPQQQVVTAPPTMMFQPGQQAQQPMYVMAQPGQVPMATNAVVMAPTQQQQQPRFVVMQPQQPTGQVAMATAVGPGVAQQQPQQQRVVVMNPQQPAGQVAMATPTVSGVAQQQTPAPTSRPEQAATPDTEGRQTNSPAPASDADVR